MAGCGMVTVLVGGAPSVKCQGDCEPLWIKNDKGEYSEAKPRCALISIVSLTEGRLKSEKSPACRCVVDCTTCQMKRVKEKKELTAARCQGTCPVFRRKELKDGDKTVYEYTDAKAECTLYIDHGDTGKQNIKCGCILAA
jgi:hypothetical protein